MQEMDNNMTGHDHLSFSNLLARSNTGSFYFSGHTPWANNASARNTEIMQKCNEAVESLSSVSNNVSQQIKTPQKPTRRKYKPKVVKEVKIDPKAQTPTKHVPDGQESKTLRRICVWKKEVSKDQECTRVEDAVGETSSQGKKLCRRVLDFEPENGENQSYSSTKHADETESAPREKQLDFGNQESKDCTPSPPSMTKRKLRQSKRKGEEPKSNGSNLSIEKSAKRRQGKKPTRLDKIDTPIKKRITGHARVQKMCSINKYIEVCLSGVNLHNIATPIKKRTTCHARVQKMCSINKLMEVSKRLAAKGCNSQNYNKLVDTRVSSSKKKQATKSKNAQTNLKTVLPNLHQFSASSAGLPPDDTLKQLHSPVLDTNRKNSETVVVPHSIKSQRNEIILSSSGAGAMVRSTPVKTQHARPKVDIDTETGKVWNLLMENNKSKGIDGSDEQEAKWWEEERNIYEGRAGSFIAQMRLVQGDRRFTPWKGSVVDSVVGVFLTQNVSDHLSSSAFMNLAAEFPARTCQNSFVSDASQKLEGAGSSSDINSNREHYLAFVKLLQSLRAAQLQGKKRDIITADTVSVEEFIPNNQYGHLRKEVGVSSNPGTLQVLPNTSPGDCSSELKDFKSLKEPTKSSVDSSEPFCCHQQDMDDLRCQKPEMYGSSSSSVPSTKRRELVTETLIPDINESTSSLDVQEAIQKPLGPDSRQHRYSLCEGLNPMDDATLNAKRKKVLKEEKERFDWDSLRREAQGRKGKRNKTTRTMDSVDWEAIRTADVSEVAEIIKSRGMNHKLAKRIQGFLDRLVTEHEGIDLEWLRDVSPDKAKEFLLSFKGLGLKSVECVRLLTLHHLAFPVDTNVGRIAVRLGWVPLQPLPESLQLHLLEMYPMIESIQKYLWPRLCKLDQETLYELHYQMITFGKVFCTKSKPNCNACPMRGECRHFASAFTSGKLALPSTEKGTPDQNPLPLHLREPLQKEQGLEVVMHSEPANKVTCCEPIIEEPASPEPEYAQVTIADIEDAFFEDPEEIPTIRLNMDALTSNLKKLTELQDRDMSTALVALTSEAASIPVPKLKNISRLRTEHQVYELPDWHPLLAELELEKREPGDPSSYLLAIWTPGETADSVQPAISKCTSQESGKLCDEEVRLSCNNIVETKSQTVRGTILIPCKTAMRGSFPLNGTYFQVNEVFADHDSSLNPIDVPRDCLWKLTRKTVFFGTSVSSIFRGLSTEKIQRCFWGGYVCVKGFDRKTRAPKPLMARLHFPASKMRKGTT